MHMADSLLSPAVGATMCVVSAVAIAYSVKKSELCKEKVPMIGVMGAFIFAAQMINVAIPATGSSGHIVGGILLAAMIGCFPAFLSMSAVLAIQCLFFADGGLLALGCNIFNLGVIPCLIVYPLFFKPFIEKGITPGRITSAAMLSSVAALQIGAFCVVLQTWFSGTTALPFAEFAMFMQPIHLAIGVLEGLATAAILCYVYKAHPKVMAFAVATLLTAGVLSLLASSNPDGLEWAVENIAVAYEFESKTLATFFMPDYGFKNAEGSLLETSIAGVAGAGLTFLLIGFAAFVASLRRRRIEV